MPDEDVDPDLEGGGAADDGAIDNDDPGTPPDADANPEGSTPAAGADDDEQPEAWRNLKSKYKIADDKALQAVVGEKYWDQTRELSRLSRENRELKAKLTPEPKGTTPEAPPAPVPPEVKELEDDIHRLDDKVTKLVAAQADRVKELSKLDTDIKKLAGQLEIAADHEKDSLRARHDRLVDKYTFAYEKWQDVNERIGEIADTKTRRTRELKWAKDVAASAEARQRDDQEAKTERAQEFSSGIQTMCASEADNMKLPKDAELRDYLWDTVRAKVMLDLQKAGDVPVEKVDVPAIIRRHVTAFAKAHGFAGRAEFADASKRKADVTGRPQVRTPGTPGKSSEPDQMAVARRRMVAKFG
jgi:hypothetical protein